MAERGRRHLHGASRPGTLLSGNSRLVGLLPVLGLGVGTWLLRTDRDLAESLTLLQRQELSALPFSSGECVIFVSLLALSLTTMIASASKRAILDLCKQDFGPKIFDVSVEGPCAQEREYRGVIHWNHDVMEKFLSILLVAGFAAFVARAWRYLLAFLMGASALLRFIPNDVNTAISLTGLALIIDGLSLVAAMTDAPGIGRTIDSLIVLLAGTVALLIEVSTSEGGGVKFSLSSPAWAVPVVAIVVGILFLVRWVIRQPHVRALLGRDKGVEQLRDSSS